MDIFQRVLYAEVDVFAIVVSCIMYANLAKRTKLSNITDERLFRAMLLVNMLILAADAGMWICDGADFPLARQLNIVTSIIFYSAPPFICSTWVVYADYRLKKSPSRLKQDFILFMIPAAANLAIAVISPFCGILFSVSEGNVYRRGPLFFLTTVICLLYLCYSLVNLLLAASRTHGTEEKRLCGLLIVFTLLPLSAAVLQAVVYGLSLIWPAMTIALMVVFTNIQNRQISTDSLTGLYNRWQFESTVPHIIRSLEPGKYIYCLVIDVDDFKSINDRFGHLVGDEALKNAAAIIGQSCDVKKNFIARLGGDEFIVVGTGDGQEEAVKISHRIENNTNRFNKQKNASYVLSLSVGIAAFPAGEVSTTDELFGLADRNMYAEKQKKKAAAAEKR